MKKQVHFFGCSFTAGDELIDQDIFPWITKEMSIQEYYNRRNEYLADPQKNEEYQIKNKLFAYPALLNSDSWQTHNHAVNGVGLRTNIYKIMELIFNQSADIIFLQVPPVGRELYVYSTGFVDSVALAFEPKKPELKNYVKSKNVSHGIYQSSLEDLMDIIMLSNLAKQKNVRLIVLDFFFELVKRSEDIAHFEDFKFIRTNYIKEIEQIDLIPLVNKIRQGKLILKGGHFSRLAHQYIADEIRPVLQEFFKP
jgi:hypothetical protein